MRLADTSYVYSNPGTTQDLRIGVVLEDPVSLETMQRNFEVNQRKKVPWVNITAPHDGTAIVCGAGPSITDTMDELASLEGDIFANNSAAGFLLGRGVDVRYQVLLDPHAILGSHFAPAREHLLASIVDPAVFDLAENPILWHPNLEWIDDRVIADCQPFAYIGGGITVSNSAMCLAYTMGYRKFHVFGMDSSRRHGRTHSWDVDILDELPCIVTENGKDYETTFDMKAQVLVFMNIHRQLTEQGCSITVHGSGLLPDMFKPS